jgi:prepilin-type N-terminal cleavage/methylation domain-containing protein
MFHISPPTHCSSGTPHSALRTPHSERGFTMVEIAISLAIIGFALVAIIGVLPIGMTVQKDNREETIINQDATVFMNAIRSGALGLDYLTNYVSAIVQEVTRYPVGSTKADSSYTNWFTFSGSSLGAQYSLTNGFRIVGLLSTPKYMPVTLGRQNWVLYSHVVAYVRSISGTASEKPAPNYGSISNLASSFSFTYRMTSEVTPYWTNYFDPSWVAFGQAGLSSNERIVRSNNWMVASAVQANLHDLRLVFAWPFTAQGTLPKTARGQSFRTLVSGQLTNDAPGSPWFFFQPRTYMTNSALFL